MRVGVKYKVIMLKGELGGRQTGQAAGISGASQTSVTKHEHRLSGAKSPTDFMKDSVGEEPRWRAQHDGNNVWRGASRTNVI
jgi:hypothetical protein